MAQEILESDLHIEEISRSIALLTALRATQGESFKSVTNHVDDLQRRIEKVSVKRRTQELPADAGNVSPTLLFIRPEPKSDNSKKRQLRELKQKNYIEAKSDDEQSEGTNDANYRKNETEENEEEDTQTKEKNKKRAKTIRSPASKDKQTVSGTPNKKQAAKSAEKLSIEEEIAVTEKDFDTAFNAFKDELKFDESKINKSQLISKMSEMSALWRLFKRQINDYKNIK